MVHLANSRPAQRRSTSQSRSVLGSPKDAVIGVVDGVEVDLDVPLSDGSVVEIVTGDSERGLHTIRHSTAHVMAQAIVDLYPARSSQSVRRSSSASTTTSSCPTARPCPMTISSGSKPGCRDRRGGSAIRATRGSSCRGGVLCGRGAVQGRDHRAGDLRRGRAARTPARSPAASRSATTPTAGAEASSVTCAPVPTCRRPVAWERSNFSPSPALTGVAMSPDRCCSESTAPLGLTKRR